MVLSAGSVPFRIFTENLYSTLSTTLNTKGIESTFVYLGSSKGQVYENLKKIKSSSNHDAYMWLSQADASKVTYFHDEVLALGFEPITMRQRVKAGLYENIDSGDPCWVALLNFDLNLAKQNNYKKVSSEIINSLQYNYIIK